MVKQRCVVFSNPTHHKSIDAAAITSPIITVPDYYYVPHRDTTHRLEEQTAIWRRPMKRPITCFRVVCWRQSTNSKPN